MYAVNISDLRKFGDNPIHPVNMLLVPVLTDTAINCEPEQGDGMALLVSETAREQWYALVHVIRKGSGRYRGVVRSQLRIYRKKGNRWELI